MLTVILQCIYIEPTEEEVSRIIQNLKDSAAECDSTSAKVLKAMHSVIAKPVSHFVNCSFKVDKFLQSPKDDIITPIHNGI